MLYEALLNRYTAKQWDNTPIEQEKIDTILNTVYLAPSKNGHYDFEIYALTDSAEGRAYKEWLYWEDAWCYTGKRPLDSNPPVSGPKRYNGQLLAPLVLLWLSKDYPKAPNSKGEAEWIRAITDCTVGATIAMCQAELLGLQTGFCASLQGKLAAEHFNKPTKVAFIAMGIGYATVNAEFDRPLLEVRKDGVLMGRDFGNIDPANRFTANRVKRGPQSSLIITV